MFSRTGLSNLLNKIQFTFEVVPFRPFQMIFALILAQRYKGVGGRWGGAGRGGEGQVGVGREEEKPPGEDTGPPVTLRWS